MIDRRAGHATELQETPSAAYCAMEQHVPRNRRLSRPRNDVRSPINVSGVMSKVWLRGSMPKVSAVATA